jgi:hypothetical protein
MLNRRMLVSVSAIVVMTMSLSACEPLRKKFTRQKRKDQTEDKNFIPVLEPLDYPAADVDPVQVYAANYHQIKAWYRDLSGYVDTLSNDKQAKYTLKQIYTHLDEMSAVSNPHAQVKIQELKMLLKYCEESLEKPVAMRNKARMQSDLREFDRKLRDLTPPK